MLREDGKYGERQVTLDGQTRTIKTILNPESTKVYEAHYGMTQEWAGQLLSLGYASALPLSFDSVSGAATKTLGQLAAQAPGTYHETFHFVLNNIVAKDNRIPPYGFKYDEARVRNALPVPATQYGSPGAGGTYNYWDEITLNPPAGGHAPRSGCSTSPPVGSMSNFCIWPIREATLFLANEGVNLLNAWLNTGMGVPHVMATATWACNTPDALNDVAIARLNAAQVQLSWPAVAAHSQVWWNTTNPYFLPGITCSAQNGCEVAPGTTFMHDALGSPAAYTSYLVQPASGCGAVTAAPSNRTASFKYALTPGQ